MTPWSAASPRLPGRHARTRQGSGEGATGMGRQPGRPFGLLDAMVLVAATAIGLGLLRATHLTAGFSGHVIPWFLTGRDRARAVCDGALFLSPVLAMWSLAVVVLAL